MSCVYKGMVKESQAVYIFIVWLNWTLFQEQE